ncbi:heme biosynthesis HemY N-terminal domain-containing protein [Allopusillimonas ginsengisoli]|uniref:heme biosynthesis HemY N-terminal domain-containing protein n=1 Tax=Allopusillimonas ginsengisoli TaxID=453575 RepID=UPI00101FB0A3|nr:heme biosynthesis HemY N-terminal domain-containing protein [Allopusillimonas ginsengisoli]TEA77284.1 heme biosynthesis protein HemY [Allopusillimonas ginsengisoli]
MKTWFWTLIVFVIAVCLALVLREHSGNVLIIAQPWRIELSLTLAVLLLVASFVVLYIVLRMFAWIGAGPERFRSWRSLRAEKRDHELLENGWIKVLEGRYADADKDLSKLIGRTRSDGRKVLAGLASARACHHLGEFSRRDEALSLASASAKDNTRLREATTTVAAEMYLDQNRPQEALELLKPMQDASAAHLQSTHLLLRAHRQLHNHERIYELTRLLLRRGAIEKSEARQLIEMSAAARLQLAGIDGYKAIWGDLKSDERTLPDIALAAATIQTAAGNQEEAAKILEAALNVKLEPRLLSAYAQCPSEQVARRLSKAEGWLKSHPDDPALLAALGKLCLTGELWGPGEHYLLRSMKLRSDLRIHALLGSLYDSLGRTGDAMKHWRLAAGVAGTMPVLPAINRYLPAADVRNDPTLVDAGMVQQTQVLRDMPPPMAASAADFFDADGGGVESAGPPASAATASAASGNVAAAGDNAGLDEYFDSAPIPGVDLSEATDLAGRSKRRD